VKFAALVLLCPLLAAQVPHRQEFEVASIKLSPPGVSFTMLDHGGPDSPTPGTWSCEYYKLRDLIAKAYSVDTSQVSGPSWMDDQRFHIQAKLPSNATNQQLREMLRNLLIDRFALKARVETRMLPRYEITVAGNTIKPQKPSSSADPEVLTVGPRTSLFFPRSTIKDLAEELTAKLQRPVVDLTGLTGEYDLRLRWTEDDSGPGLAQALHDQLGINLTEKKGLVKLVVIEHIEKLPTPN
jgi:uncharacterized protein (TIGR03435 family)